MARFQPFAFEEHVLRESALIDYMPAFNPSNPNELFLTYYDLSSDGEILCKEFTRADFLELTYRALNILVSMGLRQMSRQVHFFSGNKLEDLVLRTAALVLGSVPVTVNWQADTPDKVLFKVTSTRATVVFVDKNTNASDIEFIRSKAPSVHIVDAAAIHSAEAISQEQILHLVATNGLPSLSSIRCIIFTSGTTGDPKGVELSYANYRANAATFDSFLTPPAFSQILTPVVVNPMHHTNSTSITDWALRKEGTHLHLLERYFTGYWKILSSVVVGCSIREISSIESDAARILIKSCPEQTVVAPLVSRHIDFLDSLVESGSVGLKVETLRLSLSKTVLLLGSAPVGPSTTSRLLKYASRLPTVRFGSTETTLQVCGIPRLQSDADSMVAFEVGWHHVWLDGPCTGYYIGREHAPHTFVRVVRSVSRGDINYLVDCDPGEPGYLVTKGSHVMSSYVGLAELSAAAISDDGWYLNLGDIGFWLRSASSPSEKDLYWQSRDSHMLIRGGANYAFEQVCTELKLFLSKRYDLPLSSFLLAVCGLRVKSEHEDECCVFIELQTREAEAKKEEIDRTFLAFANEKGAVSKGARPDRMAIREIPMVVSKGVVDVALMTTFWKSQP